MDVEFNTPEEEGRTLSPSQPSARVVSIKFTEDVTATQRNARPASRAPGLQSPTTPVVSEGNLKTIPRRLHISHSLFHKMNHRRHPSNMSGASDNTLKERHHSPTGSFKSALSTIKRAATNTSNKSTNSYTPGDDSIFNITPDPLPDNPRDLEGYLNRHLSALDQLARTVEARNTEIKDYCTRAAYYYNLKPRVPNQFLRQLDAEIHVLRSQRIGLQVLVKMRWDEIVRIADHRKVLDEAKGLVCTVYEMYLGYRRVEEWEERFSV
ncbi:hypothetical protein H2200_005002 [Cladophialophora chaetospira]|uniref:Uncharacterized protein n=1 Tax=Cladophialophora chaetospira TaxID=386627 RepID=A0AA38XB53_9EURO|nr:hypothetical protein H2200_005002 [Cladophialophora chaetospira]